MCRMNKQKSGIGAGCMIHKNEEFETSIVDISQAGEGIGKSDAFTWFIKDTVIGDRVRARVMKVKKSYGYAKVVEVLEPSRDRIEPDCAIAKSCGGCNLQTMSYEAELAFKSKKVLNNIVRIGGFSKEEVEKIYEPIIGADHIFRYRNKAQFPIGYDKNGELIAGFYAGRTHNIIKTEDCLIGVKENKEILTLILDYMKEANVSAYREEEHIGLVRHVLIRKGFFTDELMVTLVINGSFLPKPELLVDKLRSFGQIMGISYNINMEKTNVILGSKTVTIYKNSFIVDTIGNIHFKISPNSFFQVNPHQTYKLYSKVLEWAGLTGEEVVWDLYCGIGSISLFLANHAKKVYGIEIVEQAILDARENAKLNGISNAKFFVGRAEEILPKVYTGEFLVEEEREMEEKDLETITHPDVIVVDPPRKGCDSACLETILKMQPNRLIYVSCDSATLARDLRILCDGGYTPEKIVAVDQFPRTVHVETVALLCRKDIDNHIEVKLELDEDDVTKAESKGTYENIKEYVLDNYGFKVSTLYIAQIKRKCGLELGENYNKSKKENSKVPECPKEKEDAIMDALRHFGMIVQEG